MTTSKKPKFPTKVEISQELIKRNFTILNRHHLQPKNQSDWQRPVWHSSNGVCVTKTGKEVFVKIFHPNLAENVYQEVEGSQFLTRKLKLVQIGAPKILAFYQKDLCLVTEILTGKDLAQILDESGQPQHYLELLADGLVEIDQQTKSDEVCRITFIGTQKDRQPAVKTAEWVELTAQEYIENYLNQPELSKIRQTLKIMPKLLRSPISNISSWALGDVTPRYLFYNQRQDQLIYIGFELSRQRPRFYDAAYFCHRLLTQEEIQSPERITKICQQFVSIFLSKFPQIEQQNLAAQFNALFGLRVLGGLNDYFSIKVGSRLKPHLKAFEIWQQKLLTKEGWLPEKPPKTVKAKLEWLVSTTQKLIDGCCVTASNGTVLYTPDGMGYYKALWTRDFAYMVENAPEMISSDKIKQCLRYLLSRQQEDGCIPDRVRPDGVPIYTAGPDEKPVAKPPLDNSQYMVILIDEFVRKTDNLKVFNEFKTKLDKAMNYVPLSQNGLVYNNPEKPHSPAGFTDTVGKTGELFFESLLYWEACKRLVNLYQKIGNRNKVLTYLKRASLIEQNIGRLWDGKNGVYLAANIDCKQIDLWGNAFAIYINFPQAKKRQKVIDFLEANYNQYVWRGQVRHLLKGEYWQRLLTPVKPEEYQNGAYWAMASGWVISAIAEKNPRLAKKMFFELILDFAENGIYECINKGYYKLATYVPSATNPLGALRRIFD